MKPDLSEIAKLRMKSQQLSGTAIQTSVDMVRWFGAIQGQEYALTKWGIGSRMPGLKDTDIEKELTTGSILRTHVLRPTWHFVTAEDIKWMLELTAPRVKALNASFMRKLHLDKTLVHKCRHIIVKLLRDGKSLTRQEINEEFRQNKITIEGQALSYVMMEAELDAIICSGPRKGNQFTYALLEERSKNPLIYSKEEALSVLTGRFFTSRGPATVHDFSVWSGLTVAECKKGIEINLKNLKHITLNNKDYYLSEQVHGVPVDVPGTFFLPPFDEYMMGYKDRSAALMFKNEQKTVNFPPNLVSMIIKNGQIIGSWRRVPGKSSISLEYYLYMHGYPVKKEIDQAVRRFSEFNNLPVRVNEILV